MESEENLSTEKQKSEQNVSLENSSLLRNTSQKTEENQPKSKSLISSENNQKINNVQTQSFIELALKDLQLSRQRLEKEIEELSRKKVQVDTELRSSFTGQSDAIARKVKGFQEYLTGATRPSSVSRAIRTCGTTSNSEAITT